LTYTQSIFL